MSHGFSWKFLVIFCHTSTGVWSKSTPNSIMIPCHLSRFHLLSVLKHDMDFRHVQVMEFPLHLLRKWWDFHRILSHFRTKPNCRSKDMRKSVSHFFQGINNNNYYYETYLSRKTCETWINDMEWSRNKVWMLTKLPLIYGSEWRGISMRIHVTFFTGKSTNDPACSLLVLKINGKHFYFIS